MHKTKKKKMTTAQKILKLEKQGKTKQEMIMNFKEKGITPKEILDSFMIAKHKKFMRKIKNHK